MSEGLQARRGGVFSAGGRRAHTGCWERAACLCPACPARCHRHKFPSCLCMSFSFTRGCSLSLLGSFRLLCRLRERACVCACARPQAPGGRAPAARGGWGLPGPAAWRLRHAAPRPALSRSGRAALGPGPPCPAGPSGPRSMPARVAPGDVGPRGADRRKGPFPALRR